ncbi:hypothetical protein FA09DRAFT_221993 [Tilletiopsis washingtonensis]|uniref:Uncharacterized protein n=1 Tax=Tilletiopsis washingtonensis TaxID=58919 RepID=A0A316ZF34_9BASI|nr:hypothetical protein FA09DRAFT_221993 [Tilletiopsis washingtonensis]PWN99846.1 hypothetical protein FA09DRAFT_221993 [Tilletiopsis washingtonensis]
MQSSSREMREKGRKGADGEQPGQRQREGREREWGGKREGEASRTAQETPRPASFWMCEREERASDEARTQRSACEPGGWADCVRQTRMRERARHAANPRGMGKRVRDRLARRRRRAGRCTFVKELCRPALPTTRQKGGKGRSGAGGPRCNEMSP